MSSILQFPRERKIEAAFKRQAELIRNYDSYSCSFDESDETDDAELIPFI